jgi:4-carboxymuconolactone decarboxylase
MSDSADGSERAERPPRGAVDRYAAGLAVRREVVGAEYVDRALAAAEAEGFSADFQRLLTEYCWGASWTREALSRRDRSLLNLAMLICLNRAEEFKLHLRGALRNGATKDEIEDTLIHATVYAGIPAGVEAFRLARAVFEEIDGPGPQ